MKSHSERVKIVRSYFEKNKLFSVVAAIIIVALIGNFIVNRVAEAKARNMVSSSVSEEITNDNAASDPVDTNINQKEDEEPHWRFYWVDVWVLLGLGGFCLFKIMQEKKKAKEKLQ
ncbi:hypothetical protein [Ruminococcus sp.]|uniref:hypothetical protein n=1 Tax=Ruminococcus sp. TaxID=41978 RepID=UPI0025E0B32F|nr:hypothetical protein [Ruminococcus sp.]